MFSFLYVEGSIKKFGQRLSYKMSTAHTLSSMAGRAVSAPRLKWNLILHKIMRLATGLINHASLTTDLVIVIAQRVNINRNG